MTEQKESSPCQCGLGLPMILFVVFLVLKLCGVIEWSWWWVAAPLWIPPAVIVAIVALALAMAWMADLLQRRRT